MNGKHVRSGWILDLNTTKRKPYNLSRFLTEKVNPLPNYFLTANNKLCGKNYVAKLNQI